MVEIASLNLFKKTEFIYSTLDVGCWTFISFSIDQTGCFLAGGGAYMKLIF
jgi:hypothetical protein